MNILLGIASQTALAIEADQLYQQTVRQELVQREIELARGIQESFLPECCPQIPGWQIATAWHAARGIGGDSYDFIRPDSKHLGLVITDVSGKGVGAALYMALSRTAIRTAALGISSPAETLRRANRILMEDSRSGMFVSVFYGLLDLESGLLTYARAGHNPPLLVRAADRSVSSLAASGVVLGILDNPEIAEESAWLAPGDTLVAYTDGVTEAVDEENQEFGEERLKQILAQATEHSASSLIDLIQAAVRVFTGEREQFDDMTLVVAKREKGG
jgi:sigma-B regulation protein RsbU (phosphoserine phosphatase)